MPATSRKNIPAESPIAAPAPQAKLPGKRKPVAATRDSAPKAAAGKKPAVKTEAAASVKADVKADSQAAAKATDKPAKDDKSRKAKLVRDSFTIPKAEYAVIDSLKLRAAKAGSPAKKSELLRAGIKLLATLDDAAFASAIQSVPAIKTGRPAKA